MPGVGILIDEKRELVHALAGYFPLNDSLSSLYTFDLKTKKLVRSLHPLDEGEHFLNDLIQDKEGNLYITDSKASAIYKMEVGAGKLERIYGSEEIQYPNGIAISEDDSKLYIASFTKGIRILDLASGKLLNKADANNWSQGIDGLEFYNGHLYGVQNGVRLHGDNFRKLELNQAQDSITAVQPILSGDSRLDLPLTFCIVDDKAVVIANSNLQYLDQSTLRITEPDSLKTTVLISVDLGVQ
ncbi:MAG: SMP-30/gluconolactonase/LRE family protein [Bacteroidota bacterium]